MKNYILLIAMGFAPVNAQVPFDMMPGNFVNQDNIIWSCLPQIGKILVCAPIPISKFCQVEKEAFDNGRLECVKPLMAKEQEIG